MKTESTQSILPMQAIRDGLGREMWRLNGDLSGSHILVASDRATRERAYALAHRVYSRAGYASSTDAGLCVLPYDAWQQTLTLLAVDAHGNDCGTISLVFDTRGFRRGLPCDEIYRDEVDALRASGCRLAEVTRLAIAETCSGATDLLLHLFNQCYIYARIVRGTSDLLVEVNPRHVSYYQRLLSFQIAGPERPCARVQGAPALLLRLNFSEIETILGQTRRENRDAHGRRRHSYPYSEAEEAAIAQFLSRSHQPMKLDEAKYFALQSHVALASTA